MACEGVSLFENVTKDAGAGQRRHFTYYNELATTDLSWIARSDIRYRSSLRKIPHTFGWEESSEFFANLQIVRQSTSLRRLQSCFHHIGLYDPDLAESMEETFDALPVNGKLRFMTAPETFEAITRLRKEPSPTVISLATFLNGESAAHGLGPAKSGYQTALGDAYYSDCPKESPMASFAESQSEDIQLFRAPCLAGDVLPIDFFSPNVQHAKETSGPKEVVVSERYGTYSAEEIALVVSKLRDAYKRVEKVSATAAQLIREFAKVLIPLKIPNGSGSTSQPRFPGRVLLSGVENASPAKIASALVHESMHQLLYVLELVGEFVVPSTEHEEKPLVKSLWSGRDLSLHSFIHACFIWYGLVRFWTLPRASEVFEESDLQIELEKSSSGFKDRNPIEALGPFVGHLRHDVVATAGTLRGYLDPLVRAANAN